MAKRRQPKIYKKACACCEQVFYATRPSAKYCSTRCQVTFYRKSSAGRQAALKAEYGKQQQQGAA